MGFGSLGMSCIKREGSQQNGQPMQSQTWFDNFPKCLMASLWDPPMYRINFICWMFRSNHYCPIHSILITFLICICIYIYMYYIDINMYIYI